MPSLPRRLALVVLLAALVMAAVACNAIFGAELGFLRDDDGGAGADASPPVDAAPVTVVDGSGTVTPTPGTDAAVEKLAFGTIGGTVTGLKGKGFILKDNGADDLQITADGPFTFPARVATGSQYSVTVSSQPSNPTQACTVTKGTGSVDGANVTDVAVACSTASSAVGGTVTGLTDTGLVLTDNGGDDLAISASGPFAFPTKLTSGAAFNVSIKTQPATGGPCNVSGGTGTIGGSDVSGVVVNCTSNTYTLGGSVSGLNGSLVIADGPSRLTLTANGAFAFPQPFATGAAFDVTVLSQPTYPPASQTCTVTNGTGNIGGANVDDVTISCTANSYAIGGTLTGLSGSITLKNGADNVVLTSDGAFSFGSKVASGNTYAVTISAPPTGQSCVITNGTGTVTNANVSNLAVSCAAVSAASIAFVSTPPDPSNASSFNFTFTVTGASGAPQCKLDRPGGPAGVFAPCTSSTSNLVSSLTDGQNTFTVQAQNAVGVTNNAVYTWTVDKTPPTVTFTSTPPNPTSQLTATFNYVITGSIGVADCRLDGPGGPGPLASCGSNTSKTVSVAGPGTYTFTVHATDGLNVTDLPFTWVVSGGPPPVPVELASWILQGSPLDSTAPYPVTSTAPGVTAGSLIRPATVNSTSFFGAFVANGFPISGPLDPAKYFELSVTSPAGTPITYDSVRFSLYDNQPSAGAWEVRSSIDTFVATLASGYVPNIDDTVGTPIVASVSSLAPRLGQVVFRIYFYNGSGAISPGLRGLRGSQAGGTDLKVFGSLN
jgi:hypothetical protein